MTGRNSQISRAYALLTLLDAAPQGLSAAELCVRLQDRGHEAGKRTIYRDLELLSKAGFPIVQEGTNEANAQRWKLMKSARIAEYLVLSTRELISLYLARKSLTPLRDTFFFEDLEKAFDKILDKLPETSREFLDELSYGVAFEPGPRWGLGVDPDVIETLRAGCAERQVLSIDYSSVNSGDRRKRRVGPHFLYFSQGSPYLVAEDLDVGKVKSYAVPRIHAAAMEDEPYDAKRVDPEEYFASSFGLFHGGAPQEVTLHFAEKTAAFVRERRWHDSQRIVSKADGTIDFKLDVAVTPDLVKWIMGFGDQVTVLSPAALAEQVAAAAERVVAKYRGKR